MSSNIKDTASALNFDLEFFNTVKGYVKHRGLFRPIFFRIETNVFLIKGFGVFILVSN